MIPSNEPAVPPVAVMPQSLASSVLADSEGRPGGWRVPSPRHRWLTLAYHAVYLKGPDTGLPERPGASGGRATSDHDFAQALEDLAGPAEISCPQPVTLEGLDSVLAAEGWRPPVDMLMRLSVTKPWLAERMRTLPEVPGLAVFLIRQRTVETGLDEGLADLLERRGFEVFADLPLTGRKRRKVAEIARGGNWNGGSWPPAAGLPARAILAFDCLPEPPGPSERRRHPLLDNWQVLNAKELIRNRINRDLPRKERFDPVHTTDNAVEAWALATELLSADQCEALRERVASRRAGMAAPWPVIRHLSRFGFRAKVELIRYDDRLAVLKTFRRTCLDCRDREVELLREFQGHAAFPALLEERPNGFVVDHVEARPSTRFRPGRRLPALLTLDQTRQLAGAIGDLLARGYDPIDLTPKSNVLIDRAGHIKLIDFEFVHRRTPPLAPDQSFGLSGLPKDCGLSVPENTGYLRNPYESAWRPYVGLGMDSLFHDPPILQLIRRILLHPAWIAVKVGRRLRRRMVIR